MAINKMIMDWETSKGIDPASPKPIYISPSGDTGVSATRQTQTDAVISGDIDSGGELYGTFNEISGTTNFPLTYERVGFVMKAMFGDATTVTKGAAWATSTAYSADGIVNVSTSTTLALKVTVAGTSDGATEPDLSASSVGDSITDATVTYVVIKKVYVHTFSSLIDSLPTFLFQETGISAGTTTQVDRYNGLMGKSIALSMSPSGDYNIGFSYVGMSHRDSVVDLITELDETNKVVTPTTRIKNEHASLLIDDSSYVVAKDFSFNYDRNTVAENFIGSGLNAGDVYAQQPTANGNLSSLFDTFLYKKAKSETTVNIAFEYVSVDNALKITLGEVKFGFKTESKKLGEKYPVNLDYTAYKNTGTELVKVELTNTIASY